MNTKKQQFIANAYGEYWEQVKDYVDENGWLKATCNFDTEYYKLVLSIRLNIECEFTENSWYEYIRPKSLQGIETNNNWISIESEDDLPKEEGKYWILLNGSISLVEFPLNTEGAFADDIKNNLITHYMPISTPSKPHY